MSSNPQTGGVSEERARSAADLVGFALQARDSGRLRSALVRGGSQPTRAQALPYVVPFVTQDRDLDWSLRLAAVIAAHPRIPNTPAPEGAGEPRVSTGRALRLIADQLHGSAGGGPERWDGDPVARRVNRIPSLPAPDMLTAVAGVLDLAQSRLPVVTFPWFHLARTALWWGNGITASSRRSRERLLLDFYA